LVIIRPENIKNELELKQLFHNIKIFNQSHITFYKNIFEVNMTVDSIKFHEFKILLNTIDLKCSDRIITIFKNLFPNINRVAVSHSNFLKIIKILRNIKLSDFNILINKEDHSKLNEILTFIPKGSHFDYKLIRIVKTKNNKIMYNFLLIDGDNYLELSDNLIAYFKSFDNTLDKLIDSCKLKALSNI
jgi:hypothetical protein